MCVCGSSGVYVCVCVCGGGGCGCVSILVVHNFKPGLCEIHIFVCTNLLVNLLVNCCSVGVGSCELVRL